MPTACHVRGIGFVDVRTCIASGNVVLRSAFGAKQVKAALAKELALRAGKPVWCWYARRRSWLPCSRATPSRTPRPIGMS